MLFLLVKDFRSQLLTTARKKKSLLSNRNPKKDW